jgi:hypothetical protein
MVVESDDARRSALASASFHFMMNAAADVSTPSSVVNTERKRERERERVRVSCLGLLMDLLFTDDSFCRRRRQEKKENAASAPNGTLNHKRSQQAGKQPGTRALKVLGNPTVEIRHENRINSLETSGFVSPCALLPGLRIQQHYIADKEDGPGYVAQGCRSSSVVRRHYGVYEDRRDGDIGVQEENIRKGMGNFGRKNECYLNIFAELCLVSECHFVSPRPCMT